MKCLNCQHIPEPGETEDHSRCPACHVFYHKSLAKKLEQAEATNQKQAEELRSAKAVHEIRGKYIEELKGREEESRVQQDGERQSAGGKAPVMGYRVKEAIADYQGAMPVVVLDIKMGFFSMVWFMVKWVLAAIPALIILFFIFVIGNLLFGGFFGFLGRIF